MKNDDFSYISIDEKNHVVATSGITWSEFYHGIDDKPKGILLMKRVTIKIDTCNLSLDYIPPERMSEFVKSDVYNLGEFHWVDFEDVASLSNVTDAELSEILFTSHMGRPLKSYKIDSLQNRYVYLGHDDGWFTKTYMDCPSNYRHVINYKICKEIKGRRCGIEPIQDDVMAWMLPLFQKGAVLDFEGGTEVGVCIYQIGRAKSMDEIHWSLDRHRKQSGRVYLEYDSRKKKWVVYN